MLFRSLLLGCLVSACATVAPPCDDGTSKCGPLCIDLGNDPSNCGSCGTICEAGDVCVAGICRSECPAGLDACSQTCVDFSSSPDHCGSCPNACVEGDVCLDGACVTVCPDPRVACDGACIDPASDPRHCGDCDTACGAGLVCSDGTCAATCQEELRMCGDRCIDTDSDRLNCGDCDYVCPGGYVCDRGACVLACPPGQADCLGRCIDVLRDAAHCGDCATRCLAGQYCDAGTCVATCSPGLTECDGACVDVDHDPLNCGGCGEPCPDDGDVHACLDGACYTLPCGDDCWGPDGCMTNGGRCIRFTCRAGNAGANFCDSCMGWRTITYQNWENDGYCADVIAKYRDVAGTATHCGGAVGCCTSAALCPGGDNAWHFHDGVNNKAVGPCLGCAGDVNCRFWDFVDNSAYTRLTACERL